MDPALHLHSGQQALTPAQEGEARRFAGERIQAQLSTEPVDEPEAEALLRQAYVMEHRPPPIHIQWVNGPLELLAAVGIPSPINVFGDNARERAGEPVVARLRASIGSFVEDTVEAIFLGSVWARVQTNIGGRIARRVWESIGGDDWARGGLRGWSSVWRSVGYSTNAYGNAAWLARERFFDAYLAPNSLHALAHFNERVSGYWLGQEHAVLVRRPKVLSRDGEGRLHSATGKCIEYHDGWGFYTWHGIRVPERVILTPETLMRDDFLKERDVEVRRVMQERMGDRFVLELDGQVIDTGPRGTLYEVRLPKDDPEGVARYVQVQDASTERSYFLRVPPTVQTASEAVAWGFHPLVDEYLPGHET